MLAAAKSNSQPVHEDDDFTPLLTRCGSNLHALELVDFPGEVCVNESQPSASGAGPRPPVDPHARAC